MTLRVLQVLGRSAGGIARHVARVVEDLHGSGMTIDVAGPPDLPLEVPRLLHPVTIPDGPTAGHLVAIRRLQAVIEEGGYAVVHAHGLRAGIDAGRAARKTSRPALLTVHNLVHPETAGRLRSRVYGFAEGLAVRSSDRVFAVSGQIADHLRRVAPGRAADIEILYLGIGGPPRIGRNRNDVRGDLSLRPEQKLIVTIARLARQKSLSTLLEALRDLSPHHLVVLGEGPQAEDLRAQARGLGIDERVSFLGFRKDVHDFLAAADVFCLSSVWEGVPLAAQEAILLGVPVVATDVGGLRELIDDRVSGRLVPKKDPQALRLALAEVLGDAGRSARYAAVAEERLQARFSTTAMLRRLESAYREAGRGERVPGGDGRE